MGLDGRECRESLAAVRATAFELVAPVRSFPVYRTEPAEQHGVVVVGHSGWTRGIRVVARTRSPDVAGLRSGGGGDVVAAVLVDVGRLWPTHSHAPDFFARLSDGTGLVIDVRPADRVRPKDAAVFATTGRACAEVGWEYRLVHESDPMLMANVRWLGGYRHPRCLRPAVAEAAPAVFAEPTPLVEGAGPASRSDGLLADGVPPAAVWPAANRSGDPVVGIVDGVGSTDGGRWYAAARSHGRNCGALPATTPPPTAARSRWIFQTTDVPRQRAIRRHSPSSSNGRRGLSCLAGHPDSPPVPSVHQGGAGTRAVRRSRQFRQLGSR